MGDAFGDAVFEEIEFFFGKEGFNGFIRVNSKQSEPYVGEDFVLLVPLSETVEDCVFSKFFEFAEVVFVNCI